VSHLPDELSRIDILLGESRAVRFESPREMVHYAELACAAADALDSDRYEGERVADLRAWAWAELGNAYRVADLLDFSDRAFLRSVDHWQDGSRDLGLLALIAERTASLLWHRRRFGDAFALLDRTAHFYRTQGRGDLAARVMIKRGLVTENSGDPAEALRLTLEALSMMDAGVDRNLLLSGIHNVLLCATELGFFELVRRLFPEVRPLYGTGDRLNLLRLRWIEGRVAAGFQKWQVAEEAFRGVRGGFLEAGLLFPASMVSLDLALLWLRQNRLGRIRALAEELIESFQALRVGREALLSLLFLREVCEGERIVASEVAEALKQAKAQIGTLWAS
jgi:tetratricopeptide (TPR) repeat protein